MIQNPEKRKSVRFNDNIPICLKDLNADMIFKAKVLNYNEKGLYFETDSFLNPGTEIYIGMQSLWSLPSSESYEYSRARIIRRKKLAASFFNYGYAAKFLVPSKKPNIEKSSLKAGKELRKYQRKAYSKRTLFVIQESLFEGMTRNISLNGVYIETVENFEVGQLITLALPFKNGKKFKIKGEVVWADGKGFGIRFLGKAKKQKSSPN